MANLIAKHLVYLVENITNLNTILLYLMEHNIITTLDSQIILNEIPGQSQNAAMLTVIRTKSWPAIGECFVEILRKTGNIQCVNKIKGDGSEKFILHPKIQKWWPDKKRLIQSLYKRKQESKLLVEVLHNLIDEDENRTVVICDSADASRYSRLGGVGKTLTAKWYAHNYEYIYNHILWIDCGEGNFLQCFQKLARDLDCKNRNEFTGVEEFAKKSYAELSQFNCLWIFDNAESYNGDCGILDVLPCQQRFSCLITSQSRYWGTENIGYGKIPDLQLNVFSEEESLAFLNKFLNAKIEHSDYELRQLCSLLNNLPLALQLAVAALNDGKISLQNYIEKTSSADLESVVNTTFVDYKKTIGRNFTVCLELIGREKCGKEALEILNILGYIRPDDIQTKFILRVAKCNLNVLEEAINLLARYALVTKTGNIVEFPYDEGYSNKIFGWNKIEVVMDLLSIHRLLQQVIRHNGKTEEKETLRKIFSCNGFIEYKLIPFTIYADEKLRNEFQKIKKELLDHRQLRQLVRKKKFADAVQWAKFIDRELTTSTTKFNLAICLDRNNQSEDSIKLLEQLFIRKEMVDDIYYDLPQLLNTFLEYLNMNNTPIDRELLDLENNPTQIEIGDFLFFSFLKQGRIEDAVDTISDIGYLIRLLMLVNAPSYHFCVNGVEVELSLVETTKIIDLAKCSLPLPLLGRLSPTELKLSGISFTMNGKELKSVIVNEFLDLKCINRLSLDCYSPNKTTMYIDLSDAVTLEYLELYNVNILNWRNAMWDIQELVLWNIRFMEKTTIKIRKLEIHGSCLDICCLPQMLEYLSLCKMDIVCSGEIDLPNLKYLSLYMDDISFLSHFHLMSLTSIHFYMMGEVNIDQLPESVNQIKIENHINTIIVGNKVKKL